ncbi:MAG: hypothetical protein ABII00_09345 [Elusimicrobiota bacterium]
MARYRKRRRIVGASKNEKKVQRRRVAGFEPANASLLREIHPSVTRLTIQLRFISPEQQLVGEETRTFSPQDPCNFASACPGSCGTGAFDVEAKIGEMVETNETHAESTGRCERERFGGIPQPCGYELHCEIDIAY